MPRKLKLRCPTCKTPVQADDPESPFCSARCRLIDLGKWASGEYVISSPLKDTDDALGEDSPPQDPARER
jgi:endogenous inhibitor of DNA gyrase (YacG/DUF329 family)